MTLPDIPGPYTEIVPQVRALRDAIEAGGVGGQGFYFLTSYADLAAAVTAIGSTRATLIIQSVAAVSANLTIPANITLFFTNAGGIQPANSVTVTILGPIEAHPIKIFYNATASQGTARFTDGTNSPDTYTVVQKEFWVEWWGAIGDNDYAKGTTNAAAINAAFVALPHGCTVRLAGKFYAIDSGIVFDHKFQCTLKGNDSDIGYADNFTKPIFVYRGTNGGTPLTLSNVYACTFQGFGVYSNDGVTGSNGGDKGIYLTQVASGFPGLTSRCSLRGLTIAALNTRTGWIGLDINDAVGANNEHHLIEELLITGGQVSPDATVQIGIQQAHTQIKSNVISRCNISGVGTGISWQGNFQGYNNTFTTVGTLYHGNYAQEATSINGDDVENCKYIFRGIQQPGPSRIQWRSCRYGSMTAAGTSLTTAHVQTVGAISFEDCFFQTLTGAQFGPYFTGGPNDGNYPPVHFRNCTWFATPVGAMGRGFASCNTRIEDGRSTWRYGQSRYTLGDEDDLRATPAGLATPETYATRRTLWVGGVQSELYAAALGLGDGEIVLTGLFMPNRPVLSQVGTAGATIRRFTLIAVDAEGRRSAAFMDTEARFVGTSSAHAALDGTNYLRLEWPAQNPAPDHYEVYEVNPADSAQWRFVSNVTPSGNAVESYNVQANPAGSFVATRPAWNESGAINFYSRVLRPNEVTFAANDATPSVAIADDFATANTSATTITNFDDGVNGQEIRIRIVDSLTTIQNNGSNIITGTGADIATTIGYVYKFIRRANVWRRIL